MRYLITGGAGFIGSHLAESLLRDGDHVTVVDDLSTGSVLNLKSFRHSDRFEFHAATVFDSRLLAELVDAADIIVHLAAAVGVKRILERQVESIRTNVEGTSEVLFQASKKGKHVLLASTSEVYGLGAEAPFTEDHHMTLGSPTKHRWSYAASKLIDECLALAYYREKKLPVRIARLFNTVGPRQTGRYGMVIPNFVRQALAGEPITVYGDGMQTRSFCHVLDTVEALKNLCRSEKAVGGIYNVGSTAEVAIKGLAWDVKAITESLSDVVLVPYSEAYGDGFEDMPRRVPDISKILLHKIWSGPTRSRDDIIRDVVSHSNKAT